MIVPLLLYATASASCAIRRTPARFPAIVAIPQAPSDSWAGPPGDAPHERVAAGLRL